MKTSNFSQEYTVNISNFTFDRVYQKNEKISLNDKAVIKKLLILNIIK